MSRLLLLVWIVIAATAVVPSSAAAARIEGPTAARPVALVKPDTLVSDGGRWAAWVPSRSPRPWLYDRSTRQARPIWRAVRIDDVSRPGIFLMSTGTHADRVMVAPSRRLRSIPGLREGDRLEQIGRRWAAGSPGEDLDSNDKLSRTLFVDWRTGRRVIADDDGGVCGFDLDHRRVPRRARRCPGFGEDQVEGPVRVGRDPRGPGLVLWHGGERTVVVRADCRWLNCHPFLASGWVTWAKPNGNRSVIRVGAYDVPTRRFFQWRVRRVNRHADARQRIEVTHLRDEMLVAVVGWVDRHRTARSYRLYAVPRPPG